ncbi:MAG TPA: hypothetical protein VFF19_02150 [Reyranella sp.]|nr:hypothetical protein [Reyranella sp.]
MQSNRRWGAETAADAPLRRGADLHLRLERLIDALDESSLRATLKLMLAETRGAIRQKQSLIALERFDGRDTADSVACLHELERLQDELTAAYARRVPPDDDTIDDEPGAAMCTATPPLAGAFRRAVVATSHERASQEREDSVGRISAAARQGEPARPQPPTARARQGRHAARPGG